MGEWVYRSIQSQSQHCIGMDGQLQAYQVKYEGYGEDEQVWEKEIYLTREGNRTIFPQSSILFIILTTTLF